MLDVLRGTWSDDSRIAYALVFGSTGRGTNHALSDVDIAIGTTGDAPLGTLDIGELTSRLETSARPMVDKTLLASKIAAIRDAAARVG